MITQLQEAMDVILCTYSL